MCVEAFLAFSLDMLADAAGAPRPVLVPATGRAFECEASAPDRARSARGRAGHGSVLGAITMIVKDVLVCPSANTASVTSVCSPAGKTEPAIGQRRE